MEKLSNLFILALVWLMELISSWEGGERIAESCSIESFGEFLKPIIRDEKELIWNL